VQAKTRDPEEALQQQTAIADVLKVISRSAFDLQTVLDTLTASTVSLCGASTGVIYLQSGDRFQIKAIANEASDTEVFRRLRETPQRPGRGSAGARVLLTGDVHNIADVQLDPDYDPALRRVIVARALLGVPLKRNDGVMVLFVLARPEPCAYTPRQIEVVETFADQAVRGARREWRRLQVEELPGRRKRANKEHKLRPNWRASPRAGGGQPPPAIRWVAPRGIYPDQGSKVADRDRLNWAESAPTRVSSPKRAGIRRIALTLTFANLPSRDRDQQYKTETFKTS
jgi:hypothetical protein